MNWAKAWHAAGLYNSTAPAKLRGPKPVGSYKVCPGTYMAQNFVPVVTPDAAKAGDNVKTTFDYVRERKNEDEAPRPRPPPLLITPHATYNAMRLASPA